MRRSSVTMPAWERAIGIPLPGAAPNNQSAPPNTRRCRQPPSGAALREGNRPSASRYYVVPLLRSSRSCCTDFSRLRFDAPRMWTAIPSSAS